MSGQGYRFLAEAEYVLYMRIRRGGLSLYLIRIIVNMKESC